jgi:hypothetical protein
MTTPETSTETAPDSAGKRSGCLGSCGLIIGLFVVFLIIAATGIFMWRRSVVRQADAMVTAIRDRGEPSSGKELTEYYQVDEGKKDCTELWLAGIAKFDSDEFTKQAKDLPFVGTADAPKFGDSWTDVEKAEALLAKYDVEMKKMHEAARLGGAARYPINFAEGLAARVPYLQNLRVGARMLRLEAYVHAQRGRPSEVVNSIDTISKAGESLTNEPTMLAQLVRTAISNVSTDVIRSGLPHIKFSDDDLLRLKEIVKSANFDGQIRSGLVGERVMGLELVNNPDQAGIERKKIPFIPEDLILYLQTMEDLIDAGELPVTEAITESTRIDDAAKDKIKNAKYLYFLTAMLLPSTDGFVRASNSGTIDRSQTEVMISIEQYRRMHGELPTKLAQLVPEFLPTVPVDPFDGKPFRYLVDDLEIKVYSVGVNGIDDGGLENQAGRGPDDVATMEISSD